MTAIKSSTTQFVENVHFKPLSNYLITRQLEEIAHLNMLATVALEKGVASDSIEWAMSELGERTNNLLSYFYDLADQDTDLSAKPLGKVGAV